MVVSNIHMPIQFHPLGNLWLHYFFHNSDCKVPTVLKISTIKASSNSGWSMGPKTSNNTDSKVLSIYDKGSIFWNKYSQPLLGIPQVLLQLGMHRKPPKDDAKPPNLFPLLQGEHSVFSFFLSWDQGGYKYNLWQIQIMTMPCAFMGLNNQKLQRSLEECFKIAKHKIFKQGWVKTVFSIPAFPVNAFWWIPWLTGSCQCEIYSRITYRIKYYLRVNGLTNMPTSL